MVLQSLFVAGSSNGRTTASEAVNCGSIPRPHPKVSVVCPGGGMVDTADLESAAKSMEVRVLSWVPEKFV